MPRVKNIALASLLVALPGWAVQDNPCLAPSSVSDVQVSLAFKGERAVFQEGEIIPLVLSFTSTAKNRYWADVRNYDRSGRLNIDYYCIEPEVPDPLAGYFEFRGGFGGGLGGIQELSAAPFIAEAELNEWRRPAPGHYRLYAVSYRVWSASASSERESERFAEVVRNRTFEIVRSNTLDFEVRAATPKWQRQQLRIATQTLAHAPSSDAALHAARTLRFLNTVGSARQLAKVFVGLNGAYSHGWDFMFGLYGSPYRDVAITAMRDELATPNHAITGDFLETLAGLEVDADPFWNSGPTHKEVLEEAQAFRTQREEHEEELIRAGAQRLVEASPRKAGAARALSLHAVLTTSALDSALARVVRPALIAAWQDLPFETQSDLIRYHWPEIASRDMLPVLRSVVAEQPLGAPDRVGLRDLALQHIHEIDPAAGRALILRDAQNVHAKPDPDLIALLSPEDIAIAIQPALQRISSDQAEDRDYELLDRFADDGALGMVRTAFEQEPNQLECAPQASVLRYFLRVAPTYGAGAVAELLRSREDTCYSLFDDLKDKLSLVQQSAIEALDDPDIDLVQDAARALGNWGSADAEAALWARLEQFHAEWAGRAGDLRVRVIQKSPGEHAAALEKTLVSAIVEGRSWVCPPEKLTRLAGLVLTQEGGEQIERSIKEWKQGPATIMPDWSPQGTPTFSVLQYSQLSEDQLRAKLSQFPRGTELLWQFFSPDHIFPRVGMDDQDELYERMRAVAKQNGLTLGKVDHP
jgi:hypothetical protein